MKLSAKKNLPGGRVAVAWAVDKIATPVVAAGSESVAQISHLQSRRFPIGRTPDRSNVSEFSDGPQAGSSAIQQIGNLRSNFANGPAGIAAKTCVPQLNSP